MTHFNYSQLRQLYNHFGFAGLVDDLLDNTIPIPTGQVNQRGVQCFYRVHPEELFLFTMTKLRSGLSNIMITDTYFGGDYNRWSYAYPWAIKYLDGRYKSIIGHQGLSRFVGDFPRFNRAIQRYVKRDRFRELPDGTMTLVPGINFLPWDVFGFIDDSIDRISTPFSGPRGDYEGAGRKAEYADSQQAFYSGYIKDHGLKVETVFLPNGISTLFGPVSARHADAGVISISNLNSFLVMIQRGQFSTADGKEVLYSAFGDSAFNLGMQCIQSYYRSFGAGGELSDSEKKCNAALKSARISIEKSYAMVSNLFEICTNLDGYKMAKERPYAMEQLRVCTLLTNCYVCLNGDTASNDNTFGVSSPSLDNYLGGMAHEA